MFDPWKAELERSERKKDDHGRGHRLLSKRLSRFDWTFLMLIGLAGEGGSALRSSVKGVFDYQQLCWQLFFVSVR